MTRSMSGPPLSGARRSQGLHCFGGSFAVQRVSARWGSGISARNSCRDFPTVPLPHESVWRSGEEIEGSIFIEFRSGEIIGGNLIRICIEIFRWFAENP